MTAYDLARLLGLAGIWSLQFIFMRLAVDGFGTGFVAEARALFGALVLVPAALLAHQPIAPLKRWREYLEISVVNNVLPFVLFAYAALTLPAGYLSILNGTVPLMAALFGYWMLGERLGRRRVLGLVFGIIGVALIVNLGPVAMDERTLAATMAGLGAAAAWALAGIMIKKRTGNLPPIGMAAGTIAYAAVLMAPLWAHAPQASWTMEATAGLIALGTLCSGVAYLAFFTLIRDIGPSRTLTVGFMTPALGVFWGWLLLGEPVTFSMLLGGALVLVAMALVLR